MRSTLVTHFCSLRFCLGSISVPGAFDNAGGYSMKQSAPAVSCQISVALSDQCPSMNVKVEDTALGIFLFKFLWCGCY